MIHVTDVDCSNLMTIFLVARTARRLFKAFVPSGVAKKCVDTRTRHVYPRRRGWYTATHVEGDPTGSAVRKQSGGCFCRPETPHSREGPRQGARRLWDALGRPDRP